jgi:hypothetical protein
MDLNKALSIWIEHMNIILSDRDKKYTGKSINGFKTGSLTRNAFLAIEEFIKSKQNSDISISKELTIQSAPSWIYSCLTSLSKDDLNETTFGYLDKVISSNQILKCWLGSTQLLALTKLKTEALSKFKEFLDSKTDDGVDNEEEDDEDDENENKIENTHETSRTNHNSNSPSSSVPQTTNINGADLDTQQQLPSNQQSLNNNNINLIDFFNLFKDQFEQMRNDIQKITSSNTNILQDDNNIDLLEIKEFNNLSMQDLINVAGYRINKKLVYEHHILIFNYHMNQKPFTTPKQLWPKYFPFPFLPDNETFVDKYDELIHKFQKEIMNFIIDFINSVILLDLNTQIDNIKLEFTKRSKNNKETTVLINKITEEQKNKLKKQFNDSYFKAVSSSGISFKRLIEDKKQSASIKEKENKNKTDKRKKKNSDDESIIHIDCSSSNSSHNNTESEDENNSKSNNKNSNIAKPSILKTKTTNWNKYSYRKKSNTFNSNYDNYYETNNNNKNNSKYCNNNKRKPSTSRNRSRSINRSNYNQYTRNRSTSRNHSKYNNMISNDNDNDKWTFTSPSRRLSFKAKDKININRRNRSNSKSVNFRLRASTTKNS